MDENDFVETNLKKQPVDGFCEGADYSYIFIDPRASFFFFFLGIKKTTEIVTLCNTLVNAILFEHYRWAGKSGRFSCRSESRTSARVPGAP